MYRKENSFPNKIKTYQTHKIRSQVNFILGNVTKIFCSMSCYVRRGAMT